MNRKDVLASFWCAVVSQNATELKTYFTPTAYVRWNNTSEQFPTEVYIIANCEYPGNRQGNVERMDLVADMAITVTRVWLSDNSASFHVISFSEFCEDNISVLNEYWGDDGTAQQSRPRNESGFAEPIFYPSSQSNKFICFIPS